MARTEAGSRTYITSISDACGLARVYNIPKCSMVVSWQVSKTTSIVSAIDIDVYHSWVQTTTSMDMAIVGMSTSAWLGLKEAFP